MVEVAAIVENWFKALLTLVALALATNVLVGPSLRWRPMFVSGALAAIVVFEYYYIFFAVMKLPRDWVQRTGVEIQRLDCRRSTKGGKNAQDLVSKSSLNPCFCPSDGYCYNLSTDDRDCKAGQGAQCTKDEPCTPCDLESIQGFLNAGVPGASRCRQCGAGNRGACNFVIDEGPYCKKYPWSMEVVPCTVCCTEPEVFYVNGTCR